MNNVVLAFGHRQEKAGKGGLHNHTVANGTTQRGRFTMLKAFFC
ncbi:MAG: hypothetical protein ACMZI0_04925 [Symbiopectobacterium sp.]